MHATLCQKAKKHNASYVSFAQKTLFSLLIFISFSQLSHAGYGRYNHASIDYYDATSGYYYRSITPKGKKGGFLGSKSQPQNISNIFLFNPTTNKGHLLFSDQNDERRITLFAHEKKFHTLKNIKTHPYENITPQNQVVSFHNYGNLSLHNNEEQAPKRAIRDHILVSVTLTKTKQTELWHCKKDGSDLKKLITIPKKSSWHLDLKAMKIRVLVPDAKLGYKVTSFDW